ncbi:hypothetical protein CMO95_02685 [Candidatus Woesearchaeota archaeon]|nr:hypothetical protein [Candidatus Woesearchaeota archaeon]|tara:strand:+ start:960 stop:1583 length:624 start_codon:yes stop_codon:yes gene_type:complete
MSILSFNEIVDVLILTFALGYIFSDMIRKPKNFDFLGSDFNDFKYAALIVTPAVLLHELAHKGVGIYFGYDSILKISLFGLGLGVILKYFNSPIIFFVPAYVISSGAFGNPENFALLALAGPAANFLLYWISDWLLISRKYPKYNHAFIVSKKINLILMAFNMIPFGFFDGAKVLAGNPMLYWSSLIIGGFLVYKNEQKWKNYAMRF